MSFRLIPILLALVCVSAHGQSVLLNRQRQERVQPSSASFTANANTWDGTAYIYRNSNFSGVSNSIVGLFSCWVKMSNDGSTCYIFSAGNNKLNIYRANDYWFYVRGYNATGTRILDAEWTTATFWTNGMAWAHVMVGWTNGTAWMRVNGSSANCTVYTTPTEAVDLTGAGAYFYGCNSPAGSRMVGCLSELWFGQEYAAATIVDSFRDSATGKPKDLGSNGSTPTGHQPLVYMRGDSNSVTNNSGYGGHFDVPSGSWTTCTSP